MTILAMELEAVKREIFALRDEIRGYANSRGATIKRVHVDNEGGLYCLEVEHNGRTYKLYTPEGSEPANDDPMVLEGIFRDPSGNIVSVNARHNGKPYKFTSRAPSKNSAYKTIADTNGKEVADAFKVLYDRCEHLWNEYKRTDDAFYYNEMALIQGILSHYTNPVRKEDAGAVE